MAKKEEGPNQAMALGEYWLRAELMHELLHTLRDMYEPKFEQLYKDGHGWEFNTYLSYWLSGLFVVVEGFNKLKLKDARVQRLFNAHLSDLKQVRHSTYHFASKRAPLIRELNWAEEFMRPSGRSFECM